MSGGEEDETTLKFTPTWVVAAVCTVIVAISLAMERLLHFAGKKLKRKNQKPLFEALQKVKEGLPLLHAFFYCSADSLSLSLCLSVKSILVSGKMKHNIGGGTWQN